MRLKWQSFYLGIILAWCPCGDLLAEPGEPKPAAPQRNLIVPPIPKGAVDGLSSDLYEERQKAYQEVQAWAEKNLQSSPELLFKAWKQSDDPEVKTRYYRLMRDMVEQRKHGRGAGFVGISMGEARVPGNAGQPARWGVLIRMVLPDTPAAKAQLRLGDVIVGVDELDLSANRGHGDLQLGRRIEPASFKFRDYIISKQPDDEVILHIMREGKLMPQKITLMKNPQSDEIKLERQDEFDRFFKSWLEKMGD